MVQTFQQTTKILQLLSDFRWSMSAGRADSQVLPWRRSWRSHSCSSLRNRRSWCSDCAVHHGRCLLVVMPRLISMVLATIENPQLLFDTVVNAHNMQVVQVFISVVAPRLTPMVLTVFIHVIKTHRQSHHHHHPQGSTRSHGCVDDVPVVVQRHCAHRQSGHCRYATETGTHSAKLCIWIGY